MGWCPPRPARCHCRGNGRTPCRPRPGRTAAVNWRPTAGAVRVHQRVLLGERVQLGHLADVVRALHLAHAAGLDGGGAVTQVVVERVVLPQQQHEVRERREVRGQRVDRPGRLPYWPAQHAAGSHLAHPDQPDRLPVGDVVVARLRKPPGRSPASFAPQRGRVRSRSTGSRSGGSARRKTGRSWRRATVSRRPANESNSMDDAIHWPRDHERRRRCSLLGRVWRPRWIRGNFDRRADERERAGG